MVINAQPLRAGTFETSRIAPDQGLDALNRRVAREQVGRDLFAAPWSTVTIGSVDVYDVFPYVESRTFQVVSDPRWNRLVYGEPGRTLRAYDGRGQALGALSQPRGMAVDEHNRLYVADAGNDRVLVLQASTEFGDMQLVPQWEIRGLADPHDVAFSDGGTPFVAGDDFLVVAETGRNRVVTYALESNGARRTGAIGDLGSGPGRFAGPMAVTVGRAEGANTPDVYVADAHTRRLVHLRRESSQLRWVSETAQDADVVTSLDADQWGNLYAAAPNQGVVRKYAPDLTPVAELRGGLDRPRSFRVPFFTVRDHRTGRVTREGRPAALSVEQWSDASGMRLWSLGVDVPDLAVTSGDAPAARFTLTDRAKVTLELVDPSTGRTVNRQSAGTLSAGQHQLALDPASLAAAGAGDLVLRVTAASAYAGGPSVTVRTAFRWAGGSVTLPSSAVLLGHWPNPVAGASRIAFVLPQQSSRVKLELFDSSGRIVRRFAEPWAAGRNEVVWDGTDDRGSRVAPGVYFYKLRAGERELTQRMVVVR
jgi:hypothetical protein